MPHVIGTAGHIDHGKTSLIKALTGQDTDRLKEEKERGISIDLGFAFLDLANGERAGVVDVPGHERFIRNMLAGSHGLDLVLFTVAADDGVMPQTQEHLDILLLLGVRYAIFVITKIDLVTKERIRAVEDEIEVLIDGTTLEHSRICHVSCLTGQGLEALRRDILETLDGIEQPQTRGYFRLPVDRAFTLHGHGLVVTGTTLGGRVAVGDRVRCLPGGQMYRVRSLQVHNQAAASAGSGQRVALNLTGEDRHSIVRGDVICDGRVTDTSDRVDAFLETVPCGAVRIENHQRVWVHVGTAARLARLVLLGRRGPIGAKQSTYCQLELSGPLLTLRGDRFIIRHETGQLTMAGGVVIRPWAKRHDRREAHLTQTLEALHRGESHQVAEAFIDQSPDFALPVRALSVFLNVREEELRAEIERMANLKCVKEDHDLLCTTKRRWEHAAASLLQVLDRYHSSHPGAPGMELESARDTLSGFPEPRLFRLFVDQLASEKSLVREASFIRLPRHTVAVSSDETALVAQVTALLGANLFSPPGLAEIERQLGVARARLVEVLKRMERNEAAVRVTADLYFLPEAVDRVRRTLHEHLATHAGVTPADFRNLFSTSRKYAIPLLEYLDRQGVTVRVGDARRLKHA